MWTSESSSVIPERIEMTKSVFQEIENTVGRFPAETGGILGMRGNKVDRFFFDKAPNGATSLSYTPNHTAINKVLAEEWTPTNTIYMGSVHSHPIGYIRPSSGDEYYARRILDHIIKNNENAKPYFYIPIVQSAADIGNFVIYSYIACYQRGMFSIKQIELLIDGKLHKPKQTSWWKSGILPKPTVQPEPPAPLKPTVLPESPAPLKLTVLPESPAPLKPTVLPESPAPLKPTVLPESPAPLMPTVQPEPPAPLKSTVQPESPTPLKSTVQPVPPASLKPTVQPEPPAPLKPTVQPEPTTLSQPIVQTGQITLQVSSEQQNSVVHDNAMWLPSKFHASTMKSKTVICIGIEHVGTFLGTLAQCGVENFVLLPLTVCPQASSYQQKKINKHIQEFRPNANIKFADEPFLDKMTKPHFLQALDDSCKRNLKNHPTDVLIADLRTQNIQDRGNCALAHALYTPYVKMNPLAGGQNSKHVIFKCPGEDNITIGFEGNANRINMIKRFIGLLLLTHTNRSQTLKETIEYAKNIDVSVTGSSIGGSPSIIGSILDCSV